MTRAPQDHSTPAGPPTPGWTGPAPMPGTDVREAARVLVGECPQLTPLPELPGRGAGAGLLDRTVAVLADLPVDRTPRGWRLTGTVAGSGVALRRARDLLDRDADALHEAWELARDPARVDAPAPVRARPEPEAETGSPSGSADRGPSGPRGARAVLRVLGPWTLAARLELPRGRVVLSDSGARRDLAEALVEGTAVLASRLSRALDRPVRVVLDEPELWRVAAGTVPGPSEFDPVAAVPLERLATATSRFAASLRERGAAEVLVRPPGRSGGIARWRVLAAPPAGETPVDGLVTPGAVLAPALAADVRRPTDRDLPRPDLDEAHELLDALAAVLAGGGLVHLEGLRPPEPRAATAPPVPEQVAGAAVRLLRLVGAAPHEDLRRLVLGPTSEEVLRGPAQAVRALAEARRAAELAPRLAE